MELTNLQIIVLFAIGGLLAVIGLMLTGKLLRPNRPNAEKLTTYECGEEPTGTAWGKFNSRFYVVALIFILFETELLFLFPWAIIFDNNQLNAQTQSAWGVLAMVEMTLFMVVLTVGLVYVWGKGYLEWKKPKMDVKDHLSAVPKALYTQMNKKYKT